MQKDHADTKPQLPKKKKYCINCRRSSIRETKHTQLPYFVSKAFDIVVRTQNYEVECPNVAYISGQNGSRLLYLYVRDFTFLSHVEC